MSKYTGVIFDLDGVICFTDKYHYQAWKAVADKLGIYFDETINNRLRGVSRMDSLEIILERYDGKLTAQEKEALAEEKNALYRRLLANMSPADLSAEVKETLDALRGIHKERAVTAEPTKSTADFGAINDEDITFTYCTEFIASRKDKARNVARLRSILNEIGDSLVVVEDDDIVKVHVHTDQPNKALEEGLKFGPLLTVKIENMREQHTAKVIEGTADAPRERVIVPAEKKFGFVAVAAGEGLKSLFTDLGADVVVQGGQTMNPSTDDILHAVDAVPAEIVFVLPNNKNIIMAAEQAVHLSEEKKVIVVPTKTIPQGISAMLAVDPEAEQDSELALAMLDAAKHVRSGQVTYAARDSEFDGKKIKQGEYLSLCEGKLCANGKETSVIKKLAREMVSDDSAFATVIFGEGVTEEQAAEVENLLHKENKEMEINVIDGGQPVYYYIISVE